MNSRHPTSETVATEPALRVSVLGRFHLSIGDIGIDLGARKDKALLAYLACAPGESHLRRRLAALLWPESVDTRARESLKQSLLRIRKSLPDGTLLTDRHTATLRLERSQVDMTRLESLVDSMRPEALADAAGLIGHELLPDLQDVSREFEEWRTLRDRGLHDNLKRALLASARQALAVGDLTQVETLAEQTVMLDPLDEEATRYLITALATDGRHGQARRAYEALQARLQSSVGVEPESATRALMTSLTVDASNASSSADGESSSPRIAVMAFEVGADESSQRYFAEGLTDDITTDLARNPRLDVLPPSLFSGLRGDPSRVLIARGATHVLQGSVRRSDGRLRVNTRLIDLHDNQIVWAERYDRTLEGVFDMQDAISSQIVTRLQLELTPDLARGLDRGTRDARAYEMFHKGRSLYLRGINNHSLRAARALLQRSIELDPGFARAYAQLAICESYLAMSIVNRTGEDFSAQVLKHGQAALMMNPALALGHAAVGLAFYAAGQYDKAERYLQDAVRIDQQLFEAQFFLARNRRLQGDHEAAVQHFRLAAVLRPDDFRSSGLLGDALKSIGDDADAELAFTTAIERIEAELEMHPDNAGALAFGAPIHLELGHKDRAEEWCRWALAIEPNDSLLRYNLARYYSLLGQADEAMSSLEVAFDAPLLVQRRLALWMRHDSDFKPVRSNPRFATLQAYAG